MILKQKLLFLVLYIPNQPYFNKRKNDLLYPIYSTSINKGHKCQHAQSQRLQQELCQWRYPFSIIPEVTPEHAASQNQLPPQVISKESCDWTESSWLITIWPVCGYLYPIQYFGIPHDDEYVVFSYQLLSIYGPAVPCRYLAIASLPDFKTSLSPLNIHM